VKSPSVDGAKFDDYCINVTYELKMADNDARDPLDLDENCPLKRGKLLLPTIQLSKNDFPSTSNKSTYSKFLRHICEFRQNLWDVGVPVLGWRQFCVSEPQNMKISQICMNHGSAA
jgi:hypothetical protein